MSRENAERPTVRRREEFEQRLRAIRPGQTWIDRDDRMGGRRVVVEQVDEYYVGYRDYHAAGLRYRSGLLRFVRAFDPAARA